MLINRELCASTRMIRLPGARSLLDYRARRAEHGPVKEKSNNNSELKGRRERRVLEEPHASLNGLLTQWGLHPGHCAPSAFHTEAHELSLGAAHSGKVQLCRRLEAVLQGGDTHLRHLGTRQSMWYQEPRSLQRGSFLGTVSSLL